MRLSPLPGSRENLHFMRNLKTRRISTELAWQEASNDMRLSPLPGSRENLHFMRNFDPF